MDSTFTSLCLLLALVKSPHAFSGSGTNNGFYVPDLSSTCENFEQLSGSGNVPKVCEHADINCVYINCSIKYLLPMFGGIVYNILVLPCGIDPDTSGSGPGYVHTVQNVAFDATSGRLYLDELTTKSASYFFEVEPDETTQEIAMVFTNVTLMQKPYGLLLGVSFNVSQAGIVTKSVLFDVLPLEISCSYVPPSATPTRQTPLPPPPSPPPPPPPPHPPTATLPTTTTSPPSSDGLSNAVVAIGSGLGVVLFIVALAATGLVSIACCFLRARGSLKGAATVGAFNIAVVAQQPTAFATKERTGRLPNEPPVGQVQTNEEVEEVEEEEVYDVINIMKPIFRLSIADFVDYATYVNVVKESELQYPRGKLTYIKDIHEGRYAKFMVMEAEDIINHPGQLPVVTKVLKNAEHKGVFDKELEWRKQFIHKNIVFLLGTCMDIASSPMLILELMEYGNLHSFVKAHGPTRHRAAVLSYQDFFKFTTDLAAALQYLTEYNYTHGAIAAKNCLVGYNMVVKLSGFEDSDLVTEQDCFTSPDCERNDQRNNSNSLLRWKSPETILHGEKNEKSDVWSFGVLMWELATYGALPYSDLQTHKILQVALAEQLELPVPKGCDYNYDKIMTSCLRKNPANRPGFADLSEALGVLQSPQTENCIYEL